MKKINKNSKIYETVADCLAVGIAGCATSMINSVLGLWCPDSIQTRVGFVAKKLARLGITIHGVKVMSPSIREYIDDLADIYNDYIADRISINYADRKRCTIV